MKAGFFGCLSYWASVFSMLSMGILCRISVTSRGSRGVTWVSPGIQNVKSAKWFSSFDWNAMENMTMKVPYVSWY